MGNWSKGATAQRQKIKEREEMQPEWHTREIWSEQTNLYHSLLSTNTHTHASIHTSAHLCSSANTRGMRAVYPAYFPSPSIASCSSSALRSTPWFVSSKTKPCLKDCIRIMISIPVHYLCMFICFGLSRCMFVGVDEE